MRMKARAALTSHKQPTSSCCQALQSPGCQTEATLPTPSAPSVAAASSNSMAEGDKGGVYDYVFLRGEGNKGISYKKYSWRPDWRLPPGVKQSKVFLQLAAILGLAAIPVWGLPYLRGGKTEEAKKENYYVTMKKKTKEERAKWIQSDDMPYK